MFKIAVVGATGNVGREILKCLYKSKINISSISPFASRISCRKQIVFGSKNIDVLKMESFFYKNIDICFFATNSEISKQYINKIKKNCGLIIDLSSYYRMQKYVPLIIPDVNAKMILNKNNNLISNPNCIVIPVCVALKPLHDFAEIKKINIVTYQSISGGGRDAMIKLFNTTKRKLFCPLNNQNFKKSNVFNVVPLINDVLDNGYSFEEQKIIKEIKKILFSDIKIHITCVRVPVFIGHSIAISIEFTKKISRQNVYNLLNKRNGIYLEGRNGEYFTPLECVGQDCIFISRIRQGSDKNSLLLWVVCDNLRKGGAFNAIQIAEKYIKEIS